MGSEVYKLSQSEWALKCDSSWYVSQATSAALPAPGTHRDIKAVSLYTGDIETQAPFTNVHLSTFHCTQIYAHIKTPEKDMHSYIHLQNPFFVCIPGNICKLLAFALIRHLP